MVRGSRQSRYSRSLLAAGFDFRQGYEFELLRPLLEKFMTRILFAILGYVCGCTAMLAFLLPNYGYGVPSLLAFGGMVFLGIKSGR